MTLSGHSGSIVCWQCRVDAGEWSSITNATATHTETPASAGVWEYRVLVQNTSCGTVYSAPRSIVVDSLSVGGSIAGGSTPILLGASTGGMTLSGHTGDIVRWEHRVDGGEWAPIANTTATHTETPASAGTWEYRTLVKHGECAAVYSLARAIVVTAQPTLPAPTHVFALPYAPGVVHLGWRMTSTHPSLGYNLYRANAAAGPYARLTSTPVMDQTNYRDTTVTSGSVYHYTVRLVDAEGRESADSSAVSVTASDSATNLYAAFTNVVAQPNVDDHCEVRIGDVNGDGLADFLVPSSDDSLDTVAHVGWLSVVVTLHDGTRAFGPLDTGFRYTGEFPWTLADLNGDGKDEIVGVIANHQDNTLKLVALNASGAVSRESPVLPHNNHVTDGDRVYVTIARLDGLHTYVIVQIGIYPNYSSWTQAYDADLQLVWSWERGGTPEAFDMGDYDSLVEADSALNYGGAHMIRSADLDGDGKDEVINGGTVVNGWTGPIPDVVWRKAFPHPDGMVPADIRPDLPGLEVFYYIEGGAMASALVSSTGVTLWNGSVDVDLTCGNCGHSWTRSVKHGHGGWCAEIDLSSPGMECHVTHDFWVDCPNCGHGVGGWVYRTFTALGEVIGTYGVACPPSDWDGVGAAESYCPGSGIRRIVPADIIGDYREELIVLQGGDDSNPLTGQLWIYTNTELVPGNKRPTPWESHQYLLDQRRTGY